MTTVKSQGFKDLQWAVGLNRLSTKICGFGRVRDGGSDWLSIVLKLRIPIFAVYLSIVLIIPMATALLTVWGDLFLVSDNLKLSLLWVIVELQYITLWQKDEEIAKMMRYIEEDWMKPKTEKERDIMVSYGKLSRILTIGGYVIVVVTILSDHIPVLFGVILRTPTNLTDFDFDRPLVMQTIYFFDVYHPPVYQIVVANQFIAGSIGGLCYTTVGTLFGVIVLHVSGQFEILYSRIENLVEGDDTDNLQIKFRITIEEHSRLIRFAEMVEDTFSLMLLEVAANFAMIFCLQGYLVIVMISDEIDRPLSQVLFGVMYGLNLLFVSLVYSAVGDTLVAQSEKIQYATYNCEWYKLEPWEAAQFIPLLVRSQKPQVITTGKFASLTLPTFATLLKTVAGYISCLLAVKE
nr:olfactory receptor 23 [Gregopimpla kuwanae]